MSQWSERISDHVTALVDYAIERGLAQEDDRVYLDQQPAGNHG